MMSDFNQETGSSTSGTTQNENQSVDEMSEHVSNENFW